MFSSLGVQQKQLLRTTQANTKAVFSLGGKIQKRIIDPKYPYSERIHQMIVNRGEWLWSPANIKRANKDAKIYVGRSTTVHNLLFCVHTLCMSNVTKTFLLVSSSVSSKQLLCFVHGQGQKREQKRRIKNFVEFHNHSPLLTMIKSNDPDFWGFEKSTYAKRSSCVITRPSPFRPDFRRGFSCGHALWQI